YVVHVGNYNTNVFNHWNGGNTTSYYTITPTQSVTLTAYYSTGTTPTATVPSAPTGLTDPSGNTQASLSWTAPANNGGSPITGYNVYRGTTSGGESSTPIATGITSTTYTDTGLTNGQTYYYTVAAVNSVGISPPSNEASATPLAPATAPGSPTGLAATAGNTQASLSWTAPANNGGSSVTNYKIYRSTSSGTETLLTTVGNVNSYTDTGLTNGVTYYFTVTAVNSVGESTPSNEANAMPAAPATAPGSPTGLAATAISSSQINLSWTAASNGGSAITGYEIDRSANSGSTWSTVQSNTGSTSTTYSDTGLTASTAYTYRVSAINAVGTSSPSNTASGTTSSGTTSTPVTITVNSVKLSGTSFTGMWVELHASNGTILATGYTPATFTVTPGVQYTVYAANYQSTIFNHWSNGSTNSSITITPTQNTALVAYYSTPVTITVNSVKLSGTSFTGMWVELHASNGTILATGYTPATFTVTPGVQYTVYAANYQSTIFNHWSNGSTNSSITITPTQNTALVAYYSTPVTITVNSVDLSGTPITGMWTVIRTPSGTTLAQGYTPTTFTVTAGNTYVVHVGNYNTNVFNHWNGGNTTSYYTITPTQSVTLTAYYSTG
ncbi:MAG: fibronectin type III domain-containing protein, partial [Nitrosotalea sp.]